MFPRQVTEFQRGTGITDAATLLNFCDPAST
jgi:hypothetical protein